MMTVLNLVAGKCAPAMGHISVTSDTTSGYAEHGIMTKGGTRKNAIATSNSGDAKKGAIFLFARLRRKRITEQPTNPKKAFARRGPVTHLRLAQLPYYE